MAETSEKKGASQQTRGSSVSSSIVVKTMEKCCWHFAEDAFNVSNV